MASYRRSKFVFESIRNFTSKIIPRNPSVPTNTISRNSILNTQKNSFSSRPTLNTTISRHSGFHCQTQQKIPFLFSSKRCYYVDPRQVHHFRPRGYRRWFQNPRNVFIVVLVSSGVCITVYFGNLETVPYTKRKHFIILSKSLEKQLGESQFEKTKKEYKAKILPAIHPDSVKVRLISKEVIEALQRGLSKDQMWIDPPPASVVMANEVRGGEGWGEGLSESTGEGKWGKEDEILDDKWVQESRMKGKEKGSTAATGHLEGLNWEVVVVDEPIVNAFCLPGGKIVVFTGLLKHFKQDAEIATIIGHEVAHAVARHSAEGMTKNLWFAILQLILYQFFMPDIVNSMSSLFLRLPFSRRMEMEADYIGLLLIASAGYDPRVAPKVFEKLGKISGESALRDYLSTHPSGKKRAQLLAQAQVMEEALSIYREVTAGRGVEGFL